MLVDKPVSINHTSTSAPATMVSVPRLVRFPLSVMVMVLLMTTWLMYWLMMFL